MINLKEIENDVLLDLYRDGVIRLDQRVTDLEAEKREREAPPPRHLLTIGYKRRPEFRRLTIPRRQAPTSPDILRRAWRLMLKAIDFIREEGEIDEETGSTLFWSVRVLAGAGMKLDPAFVADVERLRVTASHELYSFMEDDTDSDSDNDHRTFSDATAVKASRRRSSESSVGC